MRLSVPKSPGQFAERRWHARTWLQYRGKLPDAHLSRCRLIVAEFADFVTLASKPYVRGPRKSGISS
jgi:hypothetical protein